MSKCAVMHFGKKNSHYRHSINGQVLECVKEERDLEVFLTGISKYSGQCMQAHKKANSSGNYQSCNKL